MRIDSHHHFWRIARGDYGWLTKERFPLLCRDYMPSDLAPLLERCGIDKTVLVQAAQTIAETEFLLDIAHRTPFVAGVVGWVDFEAADVGAQIERLAQDGKLVGLRPMLQDIEDDAWILRPALKNAFDAVTRTGLKFDVLVFPRHLPHVARFLAANPDVSAVIDHAAKPYIASHEIEPWASQMQQIARDTSAHCKISGLLTEAGESKAPAHLKPYVDVLLENFGPERLMWGSDWPVLNLAGEYTSWLAMAENLTSRLSDGDRSAIFGGTAAKFYGISRC